MFVQSGSQSERKTTPMWLRHLGCLLLKLLDGSLVNAATLVDEVAGGGGLARVHMADHDNVDV